VPRSELACCRVGWDGVLRVVRPNIATLRLSLEPTVCVCRQLVYSYGTGNWRPTCRSGGVRASGWCHVAWTESWSETETARANERVVGGEAETCRARRRLVREAFS
jgi:hypothetical protein